MHLFSTKKEPNTTLLGHPQGLFILFLTEMWERFSFYGMRAILVLFLVDQYKGGLGWSEAATNKFYGLYIMLVYFLSIPGGFIADRYIGHKAAVLWGGILQCIGHFLLALRSEYLFFVGLSAIIIGTGLLKPNISTMVGGLYEEGDTKRDSGFAIFYMGINIGSMFAAAIVGLVGEVYGWHYGFGLAGVGMLIGLAIFILGQRYLKEIPTQPLGTPKAYKVGGTAFNVTKEEKEHLYVLMVCLLAVFIFFAAFEQAGGLLNLYAKNHTHRYVGNWEIPASTLQSLNPMCIVCLSPIVSLIWMRLTKRYAYISSIYKMGIGNIIVGLGTLFMVGAVLQKEASPTGKSDLSWLIMTYLFYTLGELSLAPVFLAFVTKIAPKSMQASIMGVFFAVVGMAGLAAGYLGALVNQLGELMVFRLTFGINALIGLLLILFNTRLMRLVRNNALDKKGIHHKAYD